MNLEIRLRSKLLATMDIVMLTKMKNQAITNVRTVFFAKENAPN